MEISQQLSRQRVKHIVSSYRLEGDEAESFAKQLDELFDLYPTPLIELAITETLVEGWLTIPLVRGLEFLKQVRQQLKGWETLPITSRVTPEQFQHITGLDPSPVFGPSELPPAQPSVRPF